MFNRVQLIGRVGKDPEIKTTQSGKQIANFSIATSEHWRDKNTGDKKEKTEWHNVVVWNEGLVKVIENYVHKGSLIMVEGKMATRKWQDQSGNDRYTTEVVLSGFDGVIKLLGSKNENGGQQDGGGSGSSGSSKNRAGTANTDMDDEIPF